MSSDKLNSFWGAMVQEIKAKMAGKDTAVHAFRTAHQVGRADQETNDVLHDTVGGGYGLGK